MISSMFVLNILSFICLLFAMFFAIKMSNKTKKITPAWLLIAIGIVFLAAYTITNIMEVIIPITEYLSEHSLGHMMDHIEFTMVAAAGILFAASFLTMKNSINKPI